LISAVARDTPMNPFKWLKSKSPPPVKQTSHGASPLPPAESSDVKLMDARCMALYDFDAAGEDELSFRKDDILLITGELNGWYLGKSLDGSAVGIFPGNYVKIIPGTAQPTTWMFNGGKDSPPHAQQQQPASKGITAKPALNHPQQVLSTAAVKPMEIRCIALWDFNAASEDELSFRKDDILLITLRGESKEWYLGRSLDGSAAGIFPANYVKILSPDTSKVAPVPAKAAAAVPAKLATPTISISAAAATVKKSLTTAPVLTSGAVGDKEAAAAPASVTPRTTHTYGDDTKELTEAKVTLTTLSTLEEDSEFWKVETEWGNALNKNIEDYTAEQIKKGLSPITFKLDAVQKVHNPVLERRFISAQARLRAAHQAAGTPPDWNARERYGFHGTRLSNISKICTVGLLRVGHPLNPSKSVDDGYFGVPSCGVYLSRYCDYTLKYSNQLAPLRIGDVVKVIMFRLLPGRSRHIPKRTANLKPTDSPGYHSHSSSNHQEWYLFDESQCCPAYILTVRAIENRRTTSDDT
jgi:chaperonin cofactor prefoldin